MALKFLAMKNLRVVGCQLLKQVYKPSILIQRSQYAVETTYNMKATRPAYQRTAAPLITEEPTSLIINWKRGTAIDSPQLPYNWSRYHYAWLRGNCHCSECYNSTVKQRILDTTKIPHVIFSSPRNVSLDQSNSDHSLNIVWEDGHESVYSVDWLAKNAYEHNDVTTKSEFEPLTDDTYVDKWAEPQAWGREITSNEPRVRFDDLLRSDHTYLEFSTAMEKYGFCYIDETPCNRQGSLDLMNRVALLRNSLYGYLHVMGGEVDSNLACADVGFDPRGVIVDVHNDLVIMDNTPRLLYLHAVSFTGPVWAENILIDGLKLVDTIKKSNPYHFKLLTALPISYHYTDQHRRYTATHILIQLDKMGKLEKIHFDNNRQLPFNHETVKAVRKINSKATMVDVYAAMNTFLGALNDKELQYRHILRPGCAVILDNHRLVHGRMPFKGNRILHTAYSDTEDWRSKVLAVRARENQWLTNLMLGYSLH